MQIDYRLSKIVIKNFRGIADLTLELRDGFPTVLIGANNAGKSTVLNAVALALNGGGYHQWTPMETDFFTDNDGNRAKEFLVQVHFAASTEVGFPAVRGVGKPSFVRGVQVKGKTAKDGRMSHTRTLFDEDGSAITLSTRTPLSAADKAKYSGHDIGFKVVNARLDDIRDYSPEIWFFRPQNIEASLYIWKTGPIAKLSSLLGEHFMSDEWEMPIGDGKDSRPMPATIYRAHKFLRDALDQLPFWTADMKPHLEEVIGRYVGSHAKIDLKPDMRALEDWIAQQLAVSLAADPEGTMVPLRNMGDGWQAVIRLAALESLTKYPRLMKERVVLLLEEPETHLHPHLRRKLRRILAELSLNGWIIIYSSHSAELVSFDDREVITRLVRSKGHVVSRSVHTDQIDSNVKIQSKIDERGAHDFLFSTAAVFCEGKDDSSAIKIAFECSGIDCDARSVSIIQCGSVTAIPAFVEISKKLGIRWCALTDEDVLPDGSVKPVTAKSRASIESFRGTSDAQIQWPIDLESCLGVAVGKATSSICFEKLAQDAWRTNHPNFSSTLNQLAAWIDPALTV